MAPAERSSKLQERVDGTVDQFSAVGQADRTVLTKITQPDQALRRCDTHVSHWEKRTAMA